MFTQIRCSCHDVEVLAEHFQGSLYRDAQGNWHRRQELSDLNKLRRAAKEIEEAQPQEEPELDEVFNQEEGPATPEEFLNGLGLGEQDNEK